MRRVGTVADGSSDLEAPIILDKGEEANVKRDEILMVEDKYQRRFLVKIADKKGRDDTLKTSTPSPGTILAREGKRTSSAKAFNIAYVRNLGQVGEKSLENRELLLTGSMAYAFDDENPMQMAWRTDQTIGFYHRPEWRVPARKEFLDYHVFIFGATGCGKSLFTRSELIPFIQGAGYTLIIFDWKGTDYTPYYEEIVFRGVEDKIIFEDRPRSPYDIVTLARQRRVLVINEGKVPESGQKLELFLKVAEYLRFLINQGKKLHLALLIDEGPQYAPYPSKGKQEVVMNVLTDLCAMGRGYELPMIILSQGVAGDVGIHPAVRRNLNTQFIGKIHPRDMDEVDKLVGRQGVDVRILAGLQPRMEDKKLIEADFYFCGSMSPFPEPLKIHFRPMDETKKSKNDRLREYQNAQAFM